MSCVLQSYNIKCNKPYCKFTNGECQFVIDGSEIICPIHGSYNPVDYPKKEIKATLILDSNSSNKKVLLLQNNKKLTKE